MRAIVFTGKGKYSLEEVPIPSLGSKDILIRVDVCGICGTDVHIYEGTFPANFPVIIGHEFAGIVEDIGEKVKNFKIGDRVTVNPNLPCRKCEQCRLGREHLCIDLLSLGIRLNGGFAEYVKAEETLVYKLQDKVDLELASLSEPLSCCIHGIDLAQIKPGDAVLIIGCGPIGLLMVQLTKLSGATKILAIDTVEKRRNLAIKLGADMSLNSCGGNMQEAIEDTLHGRPEVVIECAGNPLTQRQSVELVKLGGRVIWFGVADPENKIKIDPYYIYRNEITIKGSFINPYTTKRAVQLLSEDKLKLEGLITHRFGLESFGEAMNTHIKDPDRIKVVIKPWEKKNVASKTNCS